MVEVPIAYAITNRIEGKLRFQVTRLRWRRRRYLPFGELSLIEAQKAQIEVQVWLRILYFGRNAGQRLTRSCLLAGPSQRNIKPIRAINQAVVILRQRPRSFEGSCRRVELPQKVMSQTQVVVRIKIARS